MQTKTINGDLHIDGNLIVTDPGGEPVDLVVTGDCYIKGACYYGGAEPDEYSPSDVRIQGNATAETFTAMDGFIGLVEAA